MMTKYSLFLIGLLGTVSAFTTPSVRHSRTTTAVFSAVEEEEKEQAVTYSEDWVRAVDCASHFGRCDVTELHDLADKVEAGSDECVFQGDTKTLCDKEIEDRKDVAELLRLQAELQLGMDYLEKANLFAHDVMDEHDLRERDIEMEILGEDGI